jgi:hypothetical protein
MNKEQALQLMQQVLNESVKKGLFENMEAVKIVSEAFNLIVTELNNKNGVLGNIDSNNKF